jgi:hypothetical protein
MQHCIAELKEVSRSHSTRKGDLDYVLAGMRESEDTVEEGISKSTLRGWSKGRQKRAAGVLSGWRTGMRGRI